MLLESLDGWALSIPGLLQFFKLCWVRRKVVLPAYIQWCSHAEYSLSSGLTKPRPRKPIGARSMTYSLSLMIWEWWENTHIFLCTSVIKPIWTVTLYFIDFIHVLWLLCMHSGLSGGYKIIWHNFCKVNFKYFFQLIMLLHIYTNGLNFFFTQKCAFEQTILDRMKSAANFSKYDDKLYSEFYRRKWTI